MLFIKYYYGDQIKENEMGGSEKKLQHVISEFLLLYRSWNVPKPRFQVVLRRHTGAYCSREINLKVHLTSFP
jgi:hypothetical protein